jgi:hypothetical protein
MHMRRSSMVALLGVAALTLACQDERRRPVTAPATAQRSDTVFFVTVSDPQPPAGATVTVTAHVVQRSGFKPVASFKAHLKYDATGLTFLRESKLPSGLRAFNPQRGDIIAAGAAAEGFQDGRLFAATFSIQNPAVLPSLVLEVEELNGTDFADQLPRQPAVRRGSVRIQP